MTNATKTGVHKCIFMALNERILGFSPKFWLSSPRRRRLAVHCDFDQVVLYSD
jgi:hypothetical protein